MRTSDFGVAFIITYEGFSSEKYLCPAGLPTIGYGHVILPNESYDDAKLTRVQGEYLLRKDLVSREDAVNSLIKVPLRQNEFDALVSFIYNIGISAFKKSTLLKLLNEGNKKAAAEQFLRWNKAGGKVLKGLDNRRKAEKKLFLGA